MGPLLINGFVGTEFNYIIAILIGFAFGFILERSGFSSANRLVGVFYGYDFVVLKVFFTAAVTAGSGLMILEYLGYLDSSLLYINPTFLYPMIVGGAIMGVGFILGGYCPGTSIAAAAIGKIDAILFLIGGVLGTWVFSELFPLYSKFYESTNLGGIFVYDSLGIDKNVFMIILTVVAVGAFVFVEFLERNSKIEYIQILRKGYLSKSLLVLIFIFGLTAFILPDDPNTINNMSSKEFYQEFGNKINYITMDEVAYDIIYEKGSFDYIDVRSDKEYNKFCLPNAMNLQVKEMNKAKNREFLQTMKKKLVFYSNEDLKAAKAFILAKNAGAKNIYVLRGGISMFNHYVINGNMEDKVLASADWSGFRNDAKHFFELHPKLTKPVKKEVDKKALKISGGC